MEEDKPPPSPGGRSYPSAGEVPDAASVARDAPTACGLPAPPVVAELLAWLERDPVMRTRFAALLGIPSGLPDALNRLADELAQQRALAERRHEEVIKRFEAVDRRFEAMQAEMDRRFGLVDKRFEAMDKRFEAMDKRFEAMDKRFEALVAEMRAMRRDFRDEIGRIGGRWGDRAEAAFRRGIIDLGARYFAGTVQEVAGADDGTVFVGRPGRRVQLDVVVTDGEITVVEIKSRVRLADVDHLLRKAQWYEKRFGRAPRLQFITALIDKDAREFAGQAGITVSSSSPELDEIEEP
jgi:hypothetical protein